MFFFNMYSIFSERFTRNLTRAHDFCIGRVCLVVFEEWNCLSGLPTNGLRANIAQIISYGDSSTIIQLRRIHNDLTLTNQIVFGLSLLKSQDFFQLSERSTTRGHRFKLVKQHCCGYRRYFFNIRVVNIWNCLSKDVVNFSTLRSFKKSLNSVDFSRLLTFS